MARESQPQALRDRIFSHPETIESPSGEVITYRYNLKEYLESSIGKDWQSRLLKFVETKGEPTIRNAADESCREGESTQEFSFTQIFGTELTKEFPQLGFLYEEIVYPLMKQHVPQGELCEMEDENERMEAYVHKPKVSSQGPLRRLDAHIDRRWSAILSLSTPLEGGRLVISGDPNAHSVEEILSSEQPPTFITHIPGTVVIFPKGTELPHFTEEFLPETNNGVKNSGPRSVISMNFMREELPAAEKARFQEYLSGGKKS